MPWTPTIYTLGDGNIFEQGLIAVADVFSSSSGIFTSSGSGFGLGAITGIGLLLTLTVILISGIFKQELRIDTIFILIVLYSIMFVPTTSVTVESLESGDIYGPVSNVPIGIAYPSAIISQISTNLAQVIGTAFQATNATAPPIDLTTNGFGGPLQQLLALRNLYSEFYRNDYFDVENTLAYMSNCYVPNVANGATGGPPSQLEVMNAQNSESAILSKPPTGVTVTYSATGSSQVTCATAAQTIQSDFTAYLDNNNPTTPSDNLGYGLEQVEAQAGNSPNLANGISSSDITNDIQSLVGTSITNNANEGVNYLTNDIFGCLFASGLAYARAPFTTGGGPTLPEYCDTTASVLNSQQVNNATSGSIFEANMIPAMSLLQFLFLALSPIVAVVMVSSGLSGVKIAGKYLLFGLWTQSWIPVAAVINDYSQMTLQNAFSAGAAYINTTFQSTGIDPSNDAGAYWGSISGLSQFFDKLQNILSNADFMLSCTPIITFAIISGSIFGLTSLAQDVASRQTVNDGTGLLAPGLGNQSMFGTMGSGAAYSATYAGDGTGPGMLSNVANSTTGRFTVSQAGQLVMGQSEAMLARTSQSVSDSMSTLGSTVMSSTSGASLSTGNRWGTNSSFSTGMGTSQSAIDGLTEGLGLSERQQDAVTAAVAASVSGGGSLSAFKASLRPPAGGSTSAGSTGSLSGSNAFGLTNDQTQQLAARADQIDQSGSSTREQLATDAGRYSQGIQQQGGSLASNYQNAVSAARNYSRASEAVSSAQASTSATTGTNGSVSIGADTLTQLSNERGGAGVLAGQIASQLTPGALDAVNALKDNPTFRATQGPTSSDASRFNNAALAVAAMGQGANSASAQAVLAGMVNPAAGSTLMQSMSLISGIDSSVGQSAAGVIGSTPSVPSEIGGSPGSIAGQLDADRSSAGAGLPNAEGAYNRNDQSTQAEIGANVASGLASVSDEKSAGGGLVGGMDVGGRNLNSPNFGSSLEASVMQKSQGDMAQRLIAAGFQNDPGAMALGAAAVGAAAGWLTSGAGSRLPGGGGGRPGGTGEGGAEGGPGRPGGGRPGGGPSETTMSALGEEAGTMLRGGATPADVTRYLTAHGVSDTLAQNVVEGAIPTVASQGSPLGELAETIEAAPVAP